MSLLLSDLKYVRIRHYLTCDTSVSVAIIRLVIQVPLSTHNNMLARHIRRLVPIGRGLASVAQRRAAPKKVHEHCLSYGLMAVYGSS